MRGTAGEDGIVVPGGRERLHDSRGYGRAAGDDAILAPVEAAHLLRRGLLTTVDGRGFREFVADVDGAALRVYGDLRDRGFRLRPGRWAADPGPADLVVYERGEEPGGTVAFRLRVVGETEPIPSAELRALGDAAGGALALADGEGEVSYFGVDRPAIEGSTGVDLPSGVPVTFLDDRVVAWGAPGRLHDRGFFGQPLAAGDAGGANGGDTDGDANGALHLSLVETAYLAGTGALASDDGECDARETAVARGRACEGEQFDRRLAVYETLRAAGVVPRSGFKFGADFRTYADVESAAEPGHSQDLVWARPGDEPFSPRSLALRVRLAGGVRKRAVFAGVAANEDVAWTAVERLTP